MIRLAWVIVACLAVGACIKPPEKDADDAPHPRQQPTPTEPGLTVSGYVTVGVIKNF